ncbi:glutathione synthetase [Candidatus Photodesmus katoptron]|nr:glutathione synthetase [Candidatus Photodesmus katoptron]
MDPIKFINIKKNSTFFIMLEAQRYGCQIYYMEMNDLYFEQGIAMANSRILTLQENLKIWYTFHSKQTIELSELNIILMRKDPPFNTEYIYATYILEHAERKGTLVINKPQSLRDCNEKIFTTWFPELTPATLVTSSSEKIKAFQKRHGEIILKPLDSMGGASVFRITKNALNLPVIIEILTKNGNNYVMAQAFIPEIANGDKRILIINGEVIPYCLARIPAYGEIRANLAIGGIAEARTLNETDIKIAESVSPVLKEKGLIFVGLDIIGDKLTEINVTSPTCIREIELAFNISITRKFMDVLLSLIEKQG